MRHRDRNELTISLGRCAALAATCVTLLALGCAARYRVDGDQQSQTVRVSGTLSPQQTLISGRILVAGDPPNAPEGCGVMQTVRQLQLLFAALNAKEEKAAERFFPLDRPESFFQYSVAGPDKSAAVSDVRELAGHFRTRFLENDHFELRAIQINRWDGGLAHFGPVFATRSARDIPAGVTTLMGKGAVECKTGKFVVLNLALARANSAPIPES
jgi:hypothetical protein